MNRSHAQADLRSVGIDPADNWPRVQEDLRSGRYGDWHEVIRPAVTLEFRERVGPDSGEGLGTSDVNHIAYGMAMHGPESFRPPSLGFDYWLEVTEPQNICFGS